MSQVSGLTLVELVQFIPDEDHQITVEKLFAHVKVLDGKMVNERSLYSD